MENLKMTAINKQVKQAVRDKYAWPGGYPLFIITSDCAAICIDCARDNWRGVAHSTVTGCHDGWNATSAAINWEDPDLACDHCGENIEAAYSE